MKKDQTKKLKNYLKILNNKEIKLQINNRIREYENIDINQENVIALSNSKGEKLTLEIVNSKAILTKQMRNTWIQKEIINSNTHTIQSISMEKRPLGIIITKINKQYDDSRFFSKERQLIALESVNSIYQTTTIQKIIPKNDFKTANILDLFHKLIGTNELISQLGNDIDFLGIFPDMTTYLEIRTNINNTTIRLNKKDISAIYDGVEGKDKISRIYNLYLGIINETTQKDIQAIQVGQLPEEAFNLKTKVGLYKQIEQLVGKSILSNLNIDYQYPTNQFREKNKKKKNKIFLF